ncbi:MAG: hypothetical protein I8H71_01385 [Xanthomonadaceae bacterium]|nr:hypothetical protein [Xanthomonadaceae bacterium]
MSPKTEFRVLVSPLTKTAYAGRVRQRAGYAESAGIRHDVTSDVFAAIVDIVGAGNTHVLSVAGEPHYEVTVVDVRKQPKTATEG